MTIFINFRLILLRPKEDFFNLDLLAWKNCSMNPFGAKNKHFQMKSCFKIHMKNCNSWQLVLLYLFLHKRNNLSYMSVHFFKRLSSILPHRTRTFHITQFTLQFSCSFHICSCINIYKSSL